MVEVMEEEKVVGETEEEMEEEVKEAVKEAEEMEVD